MESFSKYHFSIIEIVGFDNFKCISYRYFLHNHRSLFVNSVKGTKAWKDQLMASIAKCVQSLQN